MNTALLLPRTARSTNTMFSVPFRLSGHFNKVQQEKGEKKLLERFRSANYMPSSQLINQSGSILSFYKDRQQTQVIKRLRQVKCKFNKEGS